MSDIARLKLTEIITAYGRSVCDDPRRCEGLLRDLCGDQRRAIHVLLGALKGRVVTDLLAAARGTPCAALLAQMARRLEEDQGLTEEAARWAVETWAQALGVISAANLAPVPSVTELATATARPSSYAAAYQNPVAPLSLTQGYCVKCRRKKQIKDASEITIRNGRPATKGVCPDCGTWIFKIGTTDR